MKKIINILSGLIITFTGHVSIGQVPIPVADQSGPIAIVGATAHLGNGEIIENSTITFDQGKITFVGVSTDANTANHEMIDALGEHIYPGFILPNSEVGLVEVSSIRAMHDDTERGTLNPNVRSVTCYNTDSEFIATFRFNGVLLAETTPRGGRISGTSSVVELEGWNWEDAAHTLDMGLHLNWPSRVNQRFDFNTFTFKTEENKNYDAQVADLLVHFEDARAYSELTEPQRNLKMEAMQGLFDGRKTLFLHVDGAKEIIEAVKFAQDNDVLEIVVLTGTSALRVADFLKDHNIGVLIPTTLRLPERTGSDVYAPYKLPRQLTEAGLTVGLYHEGMLGHARNLPFAAGVAAAYGMNKEEALKLITSNTAKLLDIDDRVGTLEVGKDATLFISEGDALDFKGNLLSHVFIRGKQITLDSKQQELYQRFSKKYGHRE